MLFVELCQQLLEEGFVDVEFYVLVVECEVIVSIMLGDGIVLLYFLGLLVKKMVVYIVIVLQGIVWGDEIVYFIFLFVISKCEYEEVMVIYDIFVIFLCECVMSCFVVICSFDEFKMVVMECVSWF